VYEIPFVFRSGTARFSGMIRDLLAVIEVVPYVQVLRNRCVRRKTIGQKWFMVLCLSRVMELRAKPGRKGAVYARGLAACTSYRGRVMVSHARGKGTVDSITLPTVKPDMLAP